jgi:hypothetical protein
MNSQSAGRPKIRATTVTGTLTLLAAIASLAIAGLARPAIVLIELTILLGGYTAIGACCEKIGDLSGRATAAQADIASANAQAAVERRQIVRTLAQLRVDNRDRDVYESVVIGEMRRVDRTVNARLDAIAEAMEKAIEAAFSNGYVQGMAARRPDDEPPPRLRSV